MPCVPGPEAGLHAPSGMRAAVLDSSRQQTEVDTAPRHRAAVSRRAKLGNKLSSPRLRDPTRSWPSKFSGGKRLRNYDLQLELRSTAGNS